MDYPEPVDDSQSDQVVDESALPPLAESPGVLGDDPEQDTEGDHEQFRNKGYEDTFAITPDEVPGQDKMPVEIGE